MMFSRLGMQVCSYDFNVKSTNFMKWIYYPVIYLCIFRSIYLILVVNIYCCLATEELKNEVKEINSDGGLKLREEFYM